MALSLDPKYPGRIITPRCVEFGVRDSNITKQNPIIAELSTTSTTNYGTVTTEEFGLPGIIKGAPKNYIRFLDDHTGEKLDRDAVSNIFDPTDIPAEISITFTNANVDVSGLSVTHITRLTRDTIDNGDGANGDHGNVKLIQYEHGYRLHTNSDIPEGTRIQVSHSGDKLPNIDWTYQALQTFSPSIKVNCYGVSPFDRSKTGTLSAHTPWFGNHGVVDFTDFSLSMRARVVRDDTRAPDSDWFPITLHKDETDDVGANGVDRVASTTDVWPITAATKANPLVITIDTSARAAPSIGDYVGPGYVLGMTEINTTPVASNVTTVQGAFLEITDVTDNGDGTHDLEIGAKDSTSYGTFTSGYLFGVVEFNDAGTKVYRFDFSIWSPSVWGIDYRIEVERLGVSRAFKADHASWNYIARAAMAGMVYRYSSVPAYASWYPEFGYERDAIFPESIVDAQYHNLVTEAYGQDGVSQGSGGAYITETELFGIFGGMGDAGDDDLYGGHMNPARELLMLREYVSAATWAESWGHPGAVTLFNLRGDTSAAAYWAGTENLGGIQQHAIWMLEFFRKMRKAGGEVRGGWWYVSGTGTGAGRLQTVPYDWTIDVYDASPRTTFFYAALSASLGRTLVADGLTTLGNALITEAESAYDRAVEIIGNGTTDPDDYYADLITANASAYASKKTTMLGDTTPRALAALHLLWAGASGNDYLTEAEARFNPQGFGNTDHDKATFIYTIIDDPLSATNIDTLKGYMVTQGASGVLGVEADSLYPNWVYVTYPYYGSFSPGKDIEKLMRGYYYRDFNTTYTETEYLNSMCRVMSHLLGNNAICRSFIRKVGERSVRDLLDVASNDYNLGGTPGERIFGYMSPHLHNSSLYWGHNNINNWYATAPSYRNIYEGTYPNDATRMMEPMPQQLPLMEAIHEHNSLVPQMEFSAHFNKDYLQAAIILHDKFGAGVTKLSSYTRLSATT